MIDGECRDLNPGSWHVAVTNLTGLRQKGLVFDRRADAEVWNQPLYSYKIKNADGAELHEISKDEAVKLLGIDATRVELLAPMDINRGDERTGQFTAPSAGEYMLELRGTGDGDLWAKKDTMVTKDSHDCKETGRSANENCKMNLNAGQTVYWMVTAGKPSHVSLGARSKGAGQYIYDTDAQHFYHVEMEIQYIVEPHDSAGHGSYFPNALTSYASSATYEYILEADAQRRVIGGEWLSGSRTTHPDFAWWPTAKPTEAFGISYADLQQLTNP
jgi:hypothetical protein